MNTAPGTAVIFVTYEGTSETPFDRDYYVDTHLPLVMASWTQYGIISAKAFFPPHVTAGTIVVCELKFRDDAALAAALASPEAAAVMGDVPNFTKLTAELSRSVPL